MDNNNFRTFSEYMKKEDNALTASMEDYLEMIYRLAMNTGFTRIHELSDALNVQPPSATKMVQRLGELGLLKYEKYGVIILEEEGRKAGEALIRRHNTIEDLLKVLGVSERAVLPETEKVEHTLSDETIKCFEEYVDFIKKNPDVAIRFNAFRNSEE
ncbi:metal-dependent transcriptional regulator [Lutispora saccharofermentans]|uniref:Manganese transport regulator n=1 Tax=Lutispora saccharofermentans TaxID=3024236 RepID=A0ABT1NJL7_9FIRM|nr:iron dependent repressor, metal binding and dimerization domain protein [Lutispora saccharofermentans]MCQ1530764.1 Fur family transcriptional regulator [Lutispora saccharofermentans]